MGNEISSAEGKVGFKVGTTWDTAVAIDSLLRVNNFSADPSRAILGNVGHNTRKRIHGKLGTEQVGVSISGTQLFCGHWLKLLANFCGTSGAGTEQTGGQGDYLHNIDISDFNTKFFTFAKLDETDVTEEVTSAFLTQFTLSGQDNALATWSAQGIGSKVINDSATNTPAVINALSHPTKEEDVVPNTTASYFRVGDYSTGTALSSSNNLSMKSYTMTISKPVTQRYGGYGATSYRTKQPKDSGIIGVQFSFTLESIDDAGLDLLAKYNAGTPLMFEQLVDGAQIGTGLNANLKIQIPIMRPLQPGQRGYTGQATIQNPTLNCEAYVAVSAPAGMSGVTYPRISTVDNVSAAYV